MSDDAKTSPIKVNAVSFNETGYYSIQEADKPFIREIRSVYIYNPHSSTHLCELTPSYELRYLYTYLVFEGEYEDTLDALSERYCYENGYEDLYKHVSDVHQFVKDNPSCAKECGEFEDFDNAYEYLQGNCPF